MTQEIEREAFEKAAREAGYLAIELCTAEKSPRCACGKYSDWHLQFAWEQRQARARVGKGEVGGWNVKDFVSVPEPRLSELKEDLQKAAAQYLAKPVAARELAEVIAEASLTKNGTWVDAAQAILARYNVSEKGE